VIFLHICSQVRFSSCRSLTLDGRHISPLVSGLVTEIGGIVSHGIKDTFAVVAMSFAGVAVWLS